MRTLYITNTSNGVRVYLADLPAINATGATLEAALLAYLSDEYYVIDLRGINETGTQQATNSSGDNPASATEPDTERPALVAQMAG